MAYDRLLPEEIAGDAGKFQAAQLGKRRIDRRGALGGVAAKQARRNPRSIHDREIEQRVSGVLVDRANVIGYRIVLVSPGWVIRFAI